MGWSTNQKAMEKRQKQTNKKKNKQMDEQDKKQKQKWKDQVTDKKAQTEQQKEQRRLQELERKQELKRLAKLQQEQLEKELARKKKKNDFNQKKVTQAELLQRQQEMANKSQNTLKNQQETYFKQENPNKLLEGYQIANTVDKALQVLDDTEERHPERRYKAAFQAYSQKRDQTIRFQYPKLKRSKRIEMMRKEFQKHADNPFNKKNVVAYNHNPKKQETAVKKQEIGEKKQEE